jgi:hypothetical protein
MAQRGRPRKSGVGAAPTRSDAAIKTTDSHAPPPGVSGKRSRKLSLRASEAAASVAAVAAAEAGAHADDTLADSVLEESASAARGGRGVTVASADITATAGSGAGFDDDGSDVDNDNDEGDSDAEEARPTSRRRPTGKGASRVPQRRVAPAGFTPALHDAASATAPGGSVASVGGKIVVFSQWTRALDVIGARLRSEGIRFVRLDGTMTPPSRADTVSAFQTDATIPVILVSLLAGGVGITLTAASNVFLFDFVYNPAMQDQAVDRVHRLGQSRVVNIFQLVADHTVESNVLALQERKRGVARGALLGVGGLGSGDAGAARTARFEELQLLMADAR